MAALYLRSSSFHSTKPILRLIRACCVWVGSVIVGVGFEQMKTDQRKNLQKNELADWLGEAVKNAGPIAMYGGAALLLLLAGYFVMKAAGARKSAAAARSWAVYRSAATVQDIEGLRDLEVEFPGTQAAAWGRQSAGDVNFATGSTFMYSDREVALKRLKEAREDFQAASKMAKSDLLKQRSLIGLAQTQEALNDFDGAQESYDRVIKDWPDGTASKIAEERLAFLKRPSTGEFYDWFFQQSVETPPPVPPLGGNIKKPSVYGDLPSNPGLELPGLGELGDGPDLTPPDASDDSTDAGDSDESESN